MRKLTALVLCFAAAALAGAWRIETVDTNAYGYCSLALDSNDYPHISYQYDDWILKYAHWNGEEWELEIVDDEYPCGWDTSIAIDSNDLPHISHKYEWAQSGIRYAHWNGSSWITMFVDSGFTHEKTSIAVDSSDIPHMAFWDGSGMVYAVWDGDSWDLEYLEYTGYADIYVSIAVDSFDRVHILYNREEDYYYSTKYAFYDGLEWQFSDTDFYGEYLSLTVDSNDLPWASYQGYGLCVAYYDGYWYTFEVDGGGYYSSIEMDENDWPHCSHANSQGLRYSWWNGSDWESETVDPIGGNCEYTSLELDSHDLPHICYFDAGTDELKYASYDPKGFHLLEPEKGEVVETLTPLLDWEGSPVPGHESYTLWWGEDPDFNSYNEVTDITESEYTITDGIEDGDSIYWRVKSIDSEDEEYWAVDMDWYFDVDLGGEVDIVDFGAGATDGGILVNWRLEGGEPAGVRILRGSDEPGIISGNLPGDSTRYLDRDVKPGVFYVYWLEVVEADGTISRFGPTAAVTIPEETPELALYAAYPSPSREVVNFAYSLPADGRAVLSVYDLSGRRVATLVDSELTAGRHEVAWDCAGIPSGVYLYRLETNSGSLTRRLVVSR